MNCFKSLATCICGVVIRDSNVFDMLVNNLNEVPIQGSKVQLFKLLMAYPLHMMAVDSSKSFLTRTIEKKSDVVTQKLSVVNICYLLINMKQAKMQYF